MKMKTQVHVLMMALIACLSIPAFPAKPQTSIPPNLPGQTATLLPDGNWLLSGGQDANGRALGTLSLFDPQGNERPLSISLQVSRMWHTATVLPDGTVLILGGIGNDGRIVQQAEIFDPDSQSSLLLLSGAPAPRTFHSATLLTDGRVLIAGGVSVSGEPPLGAELWDPRQKTSAPSGLLHAFRRNHSATLLSNGQVMLVGGKDSLGNPLATGEIFDPLSQTFTELSNPQAMALSTPGLAEVTATSPEDGATDVDVNAVISMRFSRPLRPETINTQTVTLTGPLGLLDAKIVGAEGGMLAFISPRAALVPGTTYSVKFSGATDVGNVTAGFMEFDFTTAGEVPDSDLWVPNAGWMSNRPTSKAQGLPPLEAGPGVTALSGQVLKLDGTPLKHVTLMIGSRKAFSDGTGRFLLTNVPSGHSSMMILGDTANTATRRYGIYEVGVDVKPNMTNVLRYIIWMTPLDTAHAVKISSPTTAETVVTTPVLPGLELHIPANTVITDYHGKPVTEITITPVPLDRPPFPLPNVKVPLYFTIQPGAAYIKVMSGDGPKGARLFYPNAYGYPAGTPFNFWNYDPDVKGWYVYGQGRVSADKSQVIPNAGVVIYEFSGAMVSDPNGSGGGGGGATLGGNSRGGEPVDLATGIFLYHATDLVEPDVIPLSLTRYYHQGDSASHAFGVGTSLEYDIYNIGDNASTPEGYTWQDIVLANGSHIHFPRTTPCTGPNGYCDGGLGVFYEHTSSPTNWYGATITWLEKSCVPGLLTGNWWLTTKDGTTMCFPESDVNPRANLLAAYSDRYGNQLVLTRDSNYNLTSIMSPNGRWINFTYDANNRITQATDNIGRVVTYSYDAGGRLNRVVDANGSVWNYAYDALNQMLSIQDPRGIFYLTNRYDSNGRVIRQTQADNSVFSFTYTTDPNTGKVTQTDYTDPRGFIRRTAYNSNGYKTSETFALGRPEQQTITYNRDPNTNLANSTIDALSRNTSFTYDVMGNVTSITRLAGTPNAVTTSMTFDPTFNQLASITDPLGNSTVFSFDTSGNVTAITDALGHQTTASYDSQGRAVSLTDAVGNTTQFTYSGPDLASTTDPLGNTTTRFFDNAGRIVSVTDPLNHVTRFAYNNLNKATQITDPLGGVTSLSYDPTGNLLSLTDALNHATSWTYDNMDRVATRMDPLQRQHTFTYDPNGNLASVTDRKGQTTLFQYDSLNRRTFAGFGTQGSGSGTTYASSITFSYDAGNRMTQVVDSISGSITRSYDGLDRLNTETTPQGAVSYAYDNAGRKTSMTAPCSSGAPACAPINYTWDNANRLTQIGQASSNVVINYDNANRRSSLGLPDGVEVSYSFDADSRLTGLTYSLGSIALGNLTYSYDQAGHKTQVGGSFARTNLPQPVATASYDAANELVSWGGASSAYDANGNMLSDGTNTFTWDPRNQLASVNATSMQYDAFARRTLNLAGTSFLYDGVNVVQELSGNTLNASLLNGRTDEVFSRTDSTGAFVHLKDGLGSTIALADAGGNLATSYTYGPYGSTSSNGSASSNAFQYTGRENDGNGLYYYRARYYNTILGRFISEDPVGLAAGNNLYAYVGGSPTNFVDPRGTDKKNYWDCTMEAAQTTSIANMTGADDNLLGEALLGNQLADLGQMASNLVKGNGVDAAHNGINAGLEEAAGEGAKSVAGEIPPTITPTSAAAVAYETEDSFGIAVKITFRVTESAVPAIIEDATGVKLLWDISGLLAGALVCAFQ